MVEGFQGEDLTAPTGIAACAKHFAGYGASESGRDYNTTNIPEVELRNVHLPPFKAAKDAGAATFMTSFSDLNGVPATANALLLDQILRQEWGFDGFVVSDWESIPQLTVHGLTGNARGAVRNQTPSRRSSRTAWAPGVTSSNAVTASASSSGKRRLAFSAASARRSPPRTW